MMTEKDYIAIASVINEMLNVFGDTDSFTSKDAARYTSIGLASIMAKDNPNFDRQKFLKACGVEK